ncbi:MAG: hypothetical protein WKH64_00535 [Chloroflexia bacterium]
MQDGGVIEHVVRDPTPTTLTLRQMQVARSYYSRRAAHSTPSDVAPDTRAGDAHGGYRDAHISRSRRSLGPTADA